MGYFHYYRMPIILIKIMVMITMIISSNCYNSDEGDGILIIIMMMVF